jgi:hypothetical protein
VVDCLYWVFSRWKYHSIHKNWYYIIIYIHIFINLY